MHTLSSFSWSEYWPFILLAVIALFFLLTAPLVKNRKRQIRKFAERNGFVRVPNPQGDLQAFKTLHRGSSQSFELGYESDIGGGVIVRFFEYSYFLHVPPVTTGYMQTVFAFKRPGQDLATFQLTPANLMSRVGVLLGMQNVTPYESTTFTERYRLQGEYPNAVQVVFRPELVRLLEAVPTGKELTIESAGEWILFFAEGKLIEATDLADWIEATGEWLNAFHGRPLFAPRKSLLQ